MVEWLFLAVSSGFLRFVTVVFSNHTHLLFFIGHSMTFSARILNNSDPEEYACIAILSSL